LRNDATAKGGRPITLAREPDKVARNEQVPSPPTRSHAEYGHVAYNREMYR